MVSQADKQKEKPNVVILSSDDWGWKTSKYQVSTRLARDHRVLFVSSIGFRAPSLTSSSDVSRIFRKIGLFFKGIKQQLEQLWVLTPIVVPFQKIPFRDWINKRIFRMQINSAYRQLGFSRSRSGSGDDASLPVLLVFSQNWADYLDQVPHSKLIYYVVDKHTGFAGVDGEKFKALDDAMALRSDLIVCSATETFAYYQGKNKNIQYLPHGVNYEHFATALSPLKEPADLQGLQGKRLLFFGHISHDWVDLGLCKQLARAFPEDTVVLLGRYSMANDALADCPNLVWLGEKEFEDLPAYAAYSHVGLIPFVDSELTHHCNPLKLPEYLAAGLPVVSTDIPEVHAMQKRYGEYVMIDAGASGFIEHCRHAIQMQEAKGRSEMSALVSQDTWEARVEQLMLWVAQS